jgi:hypothetical protein
MAEDSYTGQSLKKILDPQPITSDRAA